MAPALAPAALFGLIIGSFLNVVAWRLPRGESLVKPRSKCPGCDRQLKAYDNIPLFSWLVLRGRCRNCKTSISARYPVVEAVTGALYALVVAVKFDDGAQVALGLALVTFLVPLAVIDLDVRRLPNALTAPAAVVALAILALLDRDALPSHLIAAAAAGGVFVAIAYIKPGGMGMGDGKLVGVLGLYLGTAVVPAIFIGLILGTVVGVAIIASVGMTAGRKTAVPFGPFLCAGGLIAFFVGHSIVHAYLGSF